MRLLGVDFGFKRIGLAIAETEAAIITPRPPLTASGTLKADAKVLSEYAKREEAVAIVIGLPLNMDGSEGPRAQSTRAFVRNLAKMTDIPSVFWDERLSTAAVDRMLIDADQSRAKRAAVIDKLAAAYILQAALDSISPRP